MTSGHSGDDNRDDALGWAGDDDPTLVSGDESGEAERPAEPDSGAFVTTGSGSGSGSGSETDIAADADTGSVAPPEGWTVAGPASAVAAKAAADAAVTRTATSSLALVSLGIFGGIYLLYTVGWFIGVGRIQTPPADVLSESMFSLGLWLAVAAPAVWFAVTFWLTRTHPRARIGWLLLGVVLLAPLPFISGPGVIA
ncbi:DNA polymerase III subunit gamma/tau [Cryobacterium sp. TMT2-18-3]|uniref:DNA polymerase III subunit gamma/tau n=1 Tax=unclassified Cryobacterium TaxID=2649013 RepID=UPI00106BA558|nr:MULTISPECIES: DNA polymerase III subunit gamma/tau [unclassified Cryobacterium]TFC29047.1 DNA polymerase III subunit gamma/tau [Cryobacterium sp. TMT2-18-2]TFC38533.1 DNA polymerase III subunit gamma/tau [Cryobacterium sp. TMT2-42-4]TFC66341.1 DNA polymerase III subunit gamma/tau [Cryobacterium sp. TMT2-18-3]